MIHSSFIGQFLQCFFSLPLNLPNRRILGMSKLKGFADDKINVTQKLNFISVMVEIIVGKVENAGYQHFLLFENAFKGFLSQGHLKLGLVKS